MHQDFGATDLAGVVPAVLLSQPALVDAPANPRLAEWEAGLAEQTGDGTVERRPDGPGGSLTYCANVGWDDCD